MLIMAYLTALDPAAYWFFYQYAVPNGTGFGLSRSKNFLGTNLKTNLFCDSCG